MIKMNFSKGFMFFLVIIAFLLAGCNRAKNDYMATPDPVLLEIEISPNNVSIPKGLHRQFTATGIYSDKSTRDITQEVTWFSSDVIISPVSNAADTKGIVIGINSGTAIIDAVMPQSSLQVSTDLQVFPDIRMSTEITVTNKELINIQITPGNTSIAHGLGKQFTATGIYTDQSTEDLTDTVNWSSSNESVVSINNSDSKGSASTYIPGTVYIRAEMPSAPEMFAETVFVVTDAELVSIAITTDNNTIPMGVKCNFTAMGTFTDGSIVDITSAVTWTSSDSSVAQISNTIESKGLATGYAVGESTISAAMAGKNNVFLLTVSNAQLESIELSPLNASAPQGLPKQFYVIGTYQGGSSYDITETVLWDSTDDAIATISNVAGSKGILSSYTIGTIIVKATIGALIKETNFTITSKELKSISVTADNTTIIPLGNSEQFIATGIYTDNSTEDVSDLVTWSTSNGSIATISNAAGSKGFMNSNGVGIVSVTATMPVSEINDSLVCTITDAALLSIAVSPVNPSIPLGLQQQFTAIGSYTDGTTKDISHLVSWSSLNETRVLISNAPDSKGIADTIAEGDAIIRATMVADNISGTVNVTVTVTELQSITVTPAYSSIPFGRTCQFIATGNYADGTSFDLTDTVTWKSINTDIVTVSNVTNSRGLAQSHAVGVVTIEALMPQSNIKGTTDLTITTAELAAIFIGAEKLSTPLGVDQQFTATGVYTDNTTLDITESVTWSSSQGVVATISNVAGSHGLTDTVSIGATTISADLDGITETALYTVTAAELVTVEITPADDWTNLGVPKQFTAMGIYTDNSTVNITTTVTWSSSDQEIAIVSNADATRGLLTGTSTGDIIVTAAMPFTGISGSTDFTMKNFALLSIQVTAQSYMIALGRNQQFTAMGLYSDNRTRDISDVVTWTSLHNDVAVVDGDGYATSVSTGTATIRAQFGSSTGDAQLEVVAAELVSIVISPENTTCTLGTDLQLSATGFYSNGSTADLTDAVAWYSSDETKAEVSNEAGNKGLILTTGKTTGVTTIEVRLPNSVIIASTQLTITNATLASIEVIPAIPSTPLGLNKQFSAIGTYTDASTHDITDSVTWSSVTSAVATISNAPGSIGLASSVAEGSSTIVAIDPDTSISGNTLLTVSAMELVSIIISPDPIEVELGKTEDLIATGLYTNGDLIDITTSVTWTSSNETCATVSNVFGSEGLLVASSMNPGTTQITAAMPATTISVQKDAVVWPGANDFINEPFDGLASFPPDGWINNGWSLGNRDGHVSATASGAEGKYLITRSFLLHSDHDARLKLSTFQAYHYTIFDYHWDEIDVDISTDNGATWHDVAFINHEDEEWFYHIYDISGFSGEQCRLRFAHYNGDETAGSGNFIDYVKIENNAPDISLMSRRFDEVAWATTHNSFNYAGDFTMPNQNYDLTRQMEDGIRAFMLDIYEEDGVIIARHGDDDSMPWPVNEVYDDFMGTQPFQHNLNQIKSFMDEFPNEIITIIFESYVNAQDVRTEFINAGLESYLYTHPYGATWPTLQEIVDGGKRLIVFTDKNDNPNNGTMDWYMYRNNYITATHYSAHSLEELYDRTAFTRGHPANDLVILNHFLTTGDLEILGIVVATNAGGDESDSLQANSNPYFKDRVDHFMNVRGRFPNFVTVDFHDQGDIFEIVDYLNDMY